MGIKLIIKPKDEFLSRPSIHRKLDKVEKKYNISICCTLALQEGSVRAIGRMGTGYFND